MFSFRHLTKSYGHKRVLNDVTFEVPPGSITGFVGPNGAGKSTSMRLAACLENPDSGEVTIDGAAFSGLTQPLSILGCLLDAEWFHPARSGRDHLRALAAPQGISDHRVEEVLEVVGMREAARANVGSYSLGMRQRVGIAAALLGDPRNYLLDEPMNGLDPQGIAWLRDLLRAEAERGKSILLSSHLMGEIAQVADRVVVIERGEILTSSTMADFIADVRGGVEVSVEGDVNALLAELDGVLASPHKDGLTLIEGVDAADIARAAQRAGLILTHLAAHHDSLEQAYFRLLHERPEQQGRTEPHPLEQVTPTPADDPDETARPRGRHAAPIVDDAETTPVATPARRYPSRKERR
ncbi:MAG: ABC transporter ATP-binding protein [Actinomycetaceae bacterium]|nr:ABC transporter ATP-binding protein [Actinomycetaceae bacterium]